MLEAETATKEEITEFLNSKTTLNGISRDFPELSARIRNLTQFLDAEYPHREITFQMRLQTLVEGIYAPDDIPMCPVCNENKLYPLKHNGKMSGGCSTKCSRKITQQKGKQTLLETRGVEYIGQCKEAIKKRDKTNKERYGGRAPLCSDEVRKKVQNTFREKYGGHPAKSHEVKNKKKQTVRDRYGVDYYLQSDDCQQKRIQKFAPLGTTHAHQDPEAIKILEDKEQLESILKDKSLKQAGDVIGVCRGTIARYVKIHGIERTSIGKSSYLQKDIESFIKSLEIEYKTNVVGYLEGKQEFDFYFPYKNIAIEVDGVYWHSSLFMNPGYHLSKTKQAKEQGIQLIHIFEDEWVHNKECVKRKLAHILGMANEKKIPARKCVVEEMSNKEVRKFLNTYHIQGHVNGSKVLGLTHNNELVAVMSFKYNKNSCDLIRYATSCIVQGGFSKLLSYFRKNISSNEIYTFADRRWSEGDMYINNGFELAHATQPNYYYVIDDMRYNKTGFRRKNLERKLENYDPTLSEKENMEAHDIPRIYDCGLYKFVLR